MDTTTPNKIPEIKKIKSIEIENFKSFKYKESIEINNLSLFAGLNSAGKSSIAQISLLISQTLYVLRRNRITKDPYLKLNDIYIKIGTPFEILNNPKKPLKVGFYFFDSMHIEFEFSLRINNFSDNEIDEDDYVFLTSVLIEKKDSKEPIYLKVYKNNRKWNVKAKNCLQFNLRDTEQYLKTYFDVSLDKVLKSNVCFSNINDLSFNTLIPEEFTIAPTQLKNCFRKKYSESFDFDLFLTTIKETEKEIDLENILKLKFFAVIRLIRYYLIEIDNIVYIEAFRGEALRIYSNDDKNPMLFTKRFQNRDIPYDYDFQTNTIKTATYKKALSYWINKLEIADSVIVNEIIKDIVSETILKKKNKLIAINNEGFGISQILPLIAKCLLNTKGLYFVDEPEVHLHPGLQAKVGEFLFIMALIGKHIIIETHSENIINQIKYLTLIHPETKKDVSSYWVFKEERKQKIMKIEYDENGFATNAPDGFFDQTAKILREIRKIRQEKMFNKENE